MPSEDWQDEAACRPYPAELWFPDIIDSDGVEWFDDGTIWEAFGDTSPYYAQGKEICMSCPVRLQCLALALENKERWGMWGGTTPIERRRVERSQRRKRLKERRSREAEENE